MQQSEAAMEARCDHDEVGVPQAGARSLSRPSCASNESQGVYKSHRAGYGGFYGPLEELAAVGRGAVKGTHPATPVATQEGSAPQDAACHAALSSGNAWSEWLVS
jgi:hypothetical protein